MTCTHLKEAFKLLIEAGSTLSFVQPLRVHAYIKHIVYLYHKLSLIIMGLLYIKQNIIYTTHPAQQRLRIRYIFFY